MPKLTTLYIKGFQHGVALAIQHLEAEAQSCRNKARFVQGAGTDGGRFLAQVETLERLAASLKPFQAPDAGQAIVNQATKRRPI